MTVTVPEKNNVLATGVSIVQHPGPVATTIGAAKSRRPLGVGALAVHGIMTSVLDASYRFRMNTFDMVVPDGQPVRWALNILHNAGLRDRVYGPDLTLKICEHAARERLPIYFYGSRPEVLDAMIRRLRERYPGLVVAGSRPSLFRKSNPEEKARIVDEIRESGARLVFVGLGCPRQEVWVYEYVRHLNMPAIAVGAAFDFHAGLLKQAPAVLQKHGLEWLFRLCMEPARLWRRYLYLNPMFLTLLAAQAIRIRSFQDAGTAPARSASAGSGAARPAALESPSGRSRTSL